MECARDAAGFSYQSTKSNG